MDKTKFWHCPSGHILGEIEHRDHKPRLLLFRDALVGPSEAPRPIAGEVVTGHIAWTCSICGRRRHWYRENPVNSTSVLIDSASSQV